MREGEKKRREEERKFQNPQGALTVDEKKRESAKRALQRESRGTGKESRRNWILEVDIHRGRERESEESLPCRPVKEKKRL